MHFRELALNIENHQSINFAVMIFICQTDINFHHSRAFLFRVPPIKEIAENTIQGLYT